MTYLTLYQKEYTSSGEVQPHSKLLSKFSFLLLPEPVDRTISITLGSNETAESKSGELVGVNTIRTQVPNVDLDRRMVL